MMSDPKRLMNFSAGDWGATDEVSAMGRELLGSLDPTPAERERVLGRVIASAGLMAGATATVALSAKAGAAGASQVATASLGAGGMSLGAKIGLLLLVAVPITATSAYLLVDAGGGESALPNAAHPNAGLPNAGLPNAGLPNSVAVETPDDEGARSEASASGKSPSESDLDLAPGHKNADVAASDEPRPAAGKATASKSASSRPSATSASSSLVEEDRLLRSARQSAKSGDTKAALAALQLLDQRFPRGVLLQERELLRISVLNQAGSESQAEKRAQEFRQQYPDSPYGAGTEKK